MLKHKLSVLLILLLIGASFTVHHFIFRILDQYTDIFTIRKIDIEGLSLAKTTDFERLINSISNSTPKLSSLNNYTVKASLEQIPLIKEVEVYKDYPHTLSIKITERTPVATVIIQKKQHIVDEEGVILPLITEIPLPSVNAEFGIALDGTQIVDDLIVDTLTGLYSSQEKKIKSVFIDQNRNTFFTLYELSSQFDIGDQIISKQYIDRALRITQALQSNSTTPIPKKIDIHSYEDTFIGYFK